MADELNAWPEVEVETRKAIDSALKGVVNAGLRLFNPHYDMNTNCLRANVIDDRGALCYKLVCWFSGKPVPIPEPVRTPSEFLTSMRTGHGSPAIRGPHYPERAWGEQEPIIPNTEAIKAND